MFQSQTTSGAQF